MVNLFNENAGSCRVYVTSDRSTFKCCLLQISLPCASGTRWSSFMLGPKTSRLILARRSQLPKHAKMGRLKRLASIHARTPVKLSVEGRFLWHSS